MECSHDNPSHYNYCSKCGTRLMRISCHCGFNCQYGDMFCGRCGHALQEHIQQTDNSETDTARIDSSGRIQLKDILGAIKREPNTTTASITQDQIAELLNRTNKGKH